MLLLPSVKIYALRLYHLYRLIREILPQIFSRFSIISSVVISGVKQKACSISSSSLQRSEGFPSILLQCAFLIISIIEYSLFLLTPARLFFAYSSLKSYKAGLVCLSFHTGHFPNLSIKDPHKAWRFSLSAD